MIHLAGRPLAPGPDTPTFGPWNATIVLPKSYNTTFTILPRPSVPRQAISISQMPGLSAAFSLFGTDTLVGGNRQSRGSETNGDS